MQLFFDSLLLQILQFITAIDNKHNVIAQLGALEELLSGDSKHQFKRTMYIAIGHDE